MSLSCNKKLSLLLRGITSKSKNNDDFYCLNFFYSFRTKEQQESYKNANICYICKEKFEDKYLKDKIFCKGRDHYHYAEEYRGASYNICNLKYDIPKKFL